MRLGVNKLGRLRKFWRDSVFGTDGGFSIMELLLVFTIIAILSSLSMPAMRGVAASRRLKSSARAIADTFAFARDMAITERTAHLVVFDVDAGRYWLASSENFDFQNPLSSAGSSASAATGAAASANGGQVALARAGGVMGILQRLDQSITLSAIVTNRNGVNTQADTGVAYVYFSPLSTAEGATVYLRNVRNKIIAITVDATTGRTRLQDIPAELATTLGLQSKS